MWKRLATVLSNKKVMVRLAITLALLLVFRFVSHIPIPLFNADAITQAIQTEGSFFAILNNFTGGALGRFSVLALGISPYITASIVIQLLQMVVPAVKEWSEQGEEGKQKVNRVTRYVAMALAFIQGLALILGASQRGSIFVPSITKPNGFLYIYMALVITAGTAFSIWLADLITKKGIGNGTSLLITIGITSTMPAMFKTLGDTYLGTNANASNIIIFIAVILVYFIILFGVVYLQIASRKIPVQYANRQGKSDSNIPIKLNSAGVMPVIFASTIMSIPLTFGQLFNPNISDGSWLVQIFSSEKPIGFIFYVFLIVIFSFFYSFMTIDPEKIADNLSKSNAYIKGIRPGDDTKNYVARVLFKVTVIGTIYLVLLAIIPIVGVILGLPSAVTLGGTGLLIVVGVATETTQQVETDAEQTQYSGIF
ncbi:preprotein translocase subunit SecY [Haploplasma axanthum]|uniref:Protein translocase subunit SecY n=1 Tax=Haploplasma axanthum TaxID=29552 RepID=A0A449BCP9_HAPAX|nr:preprotein translocase subunit SecY [Haploplasma axanthum]VEU80110.1 preprotein translocase subunit SecY [Haploplasma axanthum]